MEERSVSLTNTSVTFFLFYFIHDNNIELFIGFFFTNRGYYCIMTVIFEKDLS